MSRSALLLKASKLTAPIGVIIVSLCDTLTASGSDIAPACQHLIKAASVTPIVYGKLGSELTTKAKEGKVRLGGCCPKKEHWYCKKCNVSF